MFRITMLPAEDGDCLLVELGTESSAFRMLIDGGRACTKDAVFSLLANLPARAAPVLDVLVLSHVDADHIEGLLELLKDEAAPTIGDVWFNGGQHIAAAAGRTVATKPARPQQPRAGSPEPVLSVGQGIDFGKLINKHGRNWNQAFGGNPLMTNGSPLPKIPIGGGYLTLVGPPKAKLAKFDPEWAAKVKELEAKGIPTLGSNRPRPKPTVANLPSIAKEMNTADQAKPNGTSIAFIIEYGGRRALFTADAHPGDIAAALRLYEPGQGRIRFDAIKVAHHGSAANNTSKLVDLLESPLWLVSTSGAQHKHPDPEGIARIVLAQPREKTLVFNYRSAFNDDWDDPALLNAYGYKASYPQGGKRTIVDLA